MFNLDIGNLKNVINPKLEYYHIINPGRSPGK